MTTYLIVIEAAGAGRGNYHYQPYRAATTPGEARELMRDYMRRLETDDIDDAALVPDYFALYMQKDGEFGMPEYFDPETTEAVDATEWLQETGRI